MPLNIEIVRGDITQLKVDAIVNAANEELVAGGGVCGAIFAAAGVDLALACESIGHCQTGSAVMTSGFGMPAKYIIHAVGPIYSHYLSHVPNQAPSLLASAYRESLALADERGLQSIAFPCISTGIYGYPNQDAAEIAFGVIKSFEAKSLQTVVICCFLESDFEIYERLLTGSR